MAFGVNHCGDSCCRDLPTVSQPCPPQWREMDRASLPTSAGPFPTWLYKPTMLLSRGSAGSVRSQACSGELWQSYSYIAEGGARTWHPSLGAGSKCARIFLFMLRTLEWPPSLSATIDWTLCNKTFGLLTHYHGLCEDLTPPSAV